MRRVNWGAPCPCTREPLRSHSYAGPVQWLSGRPSPNTDTTSLSASPLLLSQSRAVSPHFPEHWHNFHIPKNTTICLPALPPSLESPGLAAKGDEAPAGPLHPCSSLSSDHVVIDAQSLTGQCPQTPPARVVPEHSACPHWGGGGVQSPESVSVIVFLKRDHYQ